jgi:hypothetical protein
MVQGHDSDIRFFWFVFYINKFNKIKQIFFIRNRGLCLPLLKFNIDIRYWIPKVMCGGIETFRNQNDDIELWLISR